MKTKFVAILLVVCVLCGCAYSGEPYDNTEETWMQEEIPVETVCNDNIINIREEVETSVVTDVNEEEEEIGAVTDVNEEEETDGIMLLVKQCVAFTGEENEDRAKAMAKRITESEDCTAEALMLLATSEYPYVWYYGIVAECNTEETMKAFAANVVSLGKNEDRWENLSEENDAEKLAEWIVDSDYCTLGVLEILVTSECMYVWKHAVLDEDNNEATLYKLAQNVSTIEGNRIYEEWAIRLAKWIIKHDKCTDKVRSALMASPYESVWDIAMNYE